MECPLVNIGPVNNSVLLFFSGFNFFCCLFQALVSKRDLVVHGDKTRVAGRQCMWGGWVGPKTRTQGGPVAAETAEVDYFCLAHGEWAEGLLGG